MNPVPSVWDILKFSIWKNVLNGFMIIWPKILKKLKGQIESLLNQKYFQSYLMQSELPPPIKSVGLRHLPASLKGNSPIILCKLLMIALRLTRQRKYPLCSTRFVKRNWRNKASCFCLKKKKRKKENSQAKLYLRY